MNYYNPYYSMYPVVNTTNNGLFSRLFGGINFSSILNGTQKTLNIVNQAIPLAYQVKPIINNAKTVFRVMGAVRDDDTKKEEVVSSNSSNTTTTNNSSPSTSYNNSGEPSFFL